MSGFAPRIVGRLARICSAYDAPFESFGLPQKSHYNATKAHKCRQTADKLTCSKSVVGGTPYLPLVPHPWNWQPRPALMTDSLLSPNSFPTNKSCGELLTLFHKQSWF